MIVRRVKDKNVVTDQGELFTAWRYHAILEQVNADLTDSALTHMPSGRFAGPPVCLRDCRRKLIKDCAVSEGRGT